MAYFIAYNHVPVKQALRQSKEKRNRYLAWILGAAAAVAVIALPQVRHALVQLFFPGSDASTMEALEAFAADLAAGETIGEAVYGFCQEIFAAMGA